MNGKFILGLFIFLYCFSWVSAYNESGMQDILTGDFNSENQNKFNDIFNDILNEGGYGWFGALEKKFESDLNFKTKFIEYLKGKYEFMKGADIGDEYTISDVNGKLYVGKGTLLDFEKIEEYNNEGSEGKKIESVIYAGENLEFKIEDGAKLWTDGDFDPTTKKISFGEGKEYTWENMDGEVAMLKDGEDVRVTLYFRSSEDSVLGGGEAWGDKLGYPRVRMPDGKLHSTGQHIDRQKMYRSLSSDGQKVRADMMAQLEGAEPGTFRYYRDGDNLMGVRMMDDGSISDYALGGGEVLVKTDGITEYNGNVVLLDSDEFNTGGNMFFYGKVRVGELGAHDDLRGNKVLFGAEGDDGRRTMEIHMGREVEAPESSITFLQNKNLGNFLMTSEGTGSSELRVINGEKTMKLNFNGEFTVTSFDYDNDEKSKYAYSYSTFDVEGWNSGAQPIFISSELKYFEEDENGKKKMYDFQNDDNTRDAQWTFVRSKRAIGGDSTTEVASNGASSKKPDAGESKVVLSNEPGRVLDLAGVNTAEKVDTDEVSSEVVDVKEISNIKTQNIIDLATRDVLKGKSTQEFINILKEQPRSKVGSFVLRFTSAEKKERVIEVMNAWNAQRANKE